MSGDPTSLDRLHDIIAPPPVPFWPPAPGWYWLLGFLLVLVLVLVIRALIRWLHNVYRRDALRELARQEAALADPQRRASAVTNVAGVLKRTAITAFGRESVASLTGPVWSAFLEKTSHRGAAVPRSLIETTERIVYQPDFANQLNGDQIRGFTAFAHEWIAHHRADDSCAGSDFRNNETETRTRTRDEDEKET